jgi:hypothetical protein
MRVNLQSKQVTVIGGALVLGSLLIGLFYTQIINYLASQSTIELVALPAESTHSPFAGTILMMVPNQVWIVLLESLWVAAVIAAIYLCFLFFRRSRS